MLQATGEINIAGFKFFYANNIEAKSSRETLTDTAKIIVPRKLQWQGKDIIGVEDGFKVGKPVEIKLGYDHQNKTIFRGYISAIKPNVPLEFECQDAAWLLKQKTYTKSYENVTLKKLLTDICPIPFEAINVSLGKFKVKNATLTMVLDELKKAYSISAFIRDGKLYVGLAYYPQNAVTHKFEIGYNIIDSSDLEFHEEDEVKIKVKAISMLPNNKKIPWETGDPDGELRTLHFYNKTLEELKEVTAREIKKLKYSGYSGSFLTFGEPHVKHGDYVELIDNKYPERSGKYLVKAVEIQWGMNGYRQKIYLDARVN